MPPALVCSKVPPVSALYQRKVPEVTLLAVSATVPEPQREPAVTVGAVAGDEEFTVATMAVRGELSQVALLKVT